MNTPTTSIEQLRNADWTKLHDDVSLRIQLIEQAVKHLQPNPLHDKIATELILPALKLLADFCLRVEIETDPADPEHASISFSNENNEPTPESNEHKTIHLQLDSIEYWLGISEHECQSQLPSGGCLVCDLLEWKETLKAALTKKSTSTTMTTTPTIPGHFAIQQQDPDGPVFILGPEPQNRFVARMDEGTMEDATLLAASRELLETLKGAVWQWQTHGFLGPLLLADANALLTRLHSQP